MNRAEGPNGESMTLELIAVREQKIIAKVVYFGVRREFTVSVFEQDLPLTVIERLISTASLALLPVTKLHELWRRRGQIKSPESEPGAHLSSSRGFRLA